MCYAHTPNQEGQGRWHGLADHLKGVAGRAEEFALAFHGDGIARWIGLAHDIGKYSNDFQDYLKRCHQEQTLGNRARGRGPDHSSTGAWLALHLWKGTLLPAIIAGHHGGIPSREQVHIRLAERNSADMAGVVAKGLQDLPEIDQGDKIVIPEILRSGTELQQEMFYRFLFSALVDADYLDTEAHFDEGRASARISRQSNLADLRKKFLHAYEQQFGRKQVADLKNVNDVRRLVFDRCVEAGAAPPGMFRLTVPTGGGKTLSSLAFALEHAVRHGLDRIVVAIPFTSIIEQTAGVYRGFLGTDAVLEHHSLVDLADDEGSDIHAIRMRLATENWDMPVIVTTTVQLFDSLFSNRPRNCRKLHRLARSVIVLDEVQSLPGHYLSPILDVLQELSTSYGSSVVLCTATQPEYTNTDVPMRIEPREIVPEYKEHFQILRRVEYRWDPEPCSWDRVAETIAERPRILVVVNSRKDAQRLLDETEGLDGVYHLSANLCPLHRQEILREVRARLEENETPVRLIATQVVEAGVDIDFPVVMRALGPLPSLVQAAGRCNREGGEETGTVIIFDPEEGHMPPAEYRTATATALQLLDEGKDLNNPDVFKSYFRKLYSAIDQDGHNIQRLRQQYDYPEVARRFRLISDDAEPVIVKYPLKAERKKAQDDWAVEQLLKNVRWTGLSRGIMRRLNGYMVNLDRYRFEKAKERGQIQEVVPGLNVWHGEYDQLKGLTGKGLDISETVV